MHDSSIFAFPSWTSLSMLLQLHVNGISLTKEILQLGALRGVIESGVLNFAILIVSTAGFFYQSPSRDNCQLIQCYFTGNTCTDPEGYV